MLGRRKKRDDDSLELSGGMKWVKRLLHVIFYPFIHPIWFVIGIVVVFVAAISWPAYNGIEVAAMPRWYKQQFNHYYQLLSEKAEQVLPQPELGTGFEMSGRGINVKTVDRKPGKADMVTYETPQMVNRRVFQKAQDIPIDVAATLQRAQPEPEVPEFRRNDALGLVYLETPKKISGTIRVVNANELKIGNELFFLYGIYASPASNEGLAAMHYLQQNVDGKPADCYIGAYTTDGTATAICIYEGLNINQRLVDLKYSKNVSLN